MRERLAVVSMIGLLAAGVARAQEGGQQPAPANQPPSAAGQQAPAGQPSATPTPQQSQSPTQPEQPPTPAPGTEAQQGGEAPPGGEAQQTPPFQPDTRPLAGAEVITPTLPNPGRNYILPTFSVFEGADSNAQLIPGTSQFLTVTTPLATAQLNRVGRNSQFTAAYSGGAEIYPTESKLNSWFQEFGFSERYTGRRWDVLFADQYSYLPQAEYGFAGIGLGGTFNETSALGIGGGLGQLNSFFTPGESSIISGLGGRTSEVGIGQIQYHATSRTSLTAVGSFGIVDYTQSSLISDNQRIGLVSVDHSLTDRDTISVSYSFAALRYNGFGVATNDNLWRFGYGRRVSDRLALNLLAGPELTYTALRGIFGTQTRLSWAGQGRLTYQIERTSLALNYLHYVTAGSGVFGGALTDLAHGDVRRELTRTLTASVDIGYSRNVPLGAFSINSGYPAGLQLDYEYGNLRIDKKIGRNVRAFLNYEVQRQESSELLPGAVGLVLVRHVFGIGFDVHTRPLGI